jgi:DNA repair exonuclease SbcCD ATPase subunit
MIITKLTIVNFRSYYGINTFKFSDQLNLILGSNGDGKTTFFDAINWVLTPDYAPKSDDDKLPDLSSLVSARMFKELNVGIKGRVAVILDVKNNSGHPRTIERSFNVFKNNDGSISIDGSTHKVYQTIGTRRQDLTSLKQVFESEGLFPAVLKKYHIFKGEEKLNIFQDKTTLEDLINRFTEIKNLNSFIQFATYAEKTSHDLVSGTKEKNNKITAKITEIQNEIVALSKKKAQMEDEIKRARKEYNEASDNIDSIENDYEIIKKASALEKQIVELENEVYRLSDKIDEEYSFKLLDDQWILLGFAPILREFNNKMDSLKTSKENIENEYRKKQEEEWQKEQIAKAKSELEKIAWSYSDVEKMKHMLVAQRCFYCGCDAPEGSVRYDFIQQRINDVIQILTPQKGNKRPEIKPYFKARNIDDLYNLGRSLKDTGKDIPGIPDEIESAFHSNDDKRATISKKSALIDELRKDITTMYATSSSGENLKDYVSNIAVVNRWHDLKQESAIEIDRLTHKSIPEIEEKISKKRLEQSKITKGTGLDSLLQINEFFRLLNNAMIDTQDSIYEEFLARLAKEANVFLAMLNVDDFTGIIKIYLDRFNNLKIELQDKNGKVITNPNTSLLTTMHISILFAISELTKENQNAVYPLIFDAPTSSFDEGKDKTFYECLNAHVNKQCIVVTKSYLYKDGNGEFAIDEKALSKINCKKFRIKKEEGFDKLDISTISTIVKEL